MMFSDEEIKENNLMRPGDEIICIQKVCLNDKFDKRDLDFSGPPLLPLAGHHDLEEARLFRDGFFPESLDGTQTKFAWTEEDGNIAAMVSEPGFGTTGQTSFGKDLDAAWKRETKGDNSQLISPRNSDIMFVEKAHEPNEETCTSSGIEKDNSKSKWKVDKSDPRSRLHYVKFVKRHGRTIKLWECGICGRDFQHQYTLMRHLPTHTDERNFRCDECSKSFRQLSTLSQHKAIHSSERPYACEVCLKTFNRVSTLISHRKTHSGDKPYKCNICTKGFHQKGNLRNHLFTHTNERPYRCNICLKGFNQQSNLVCHKFKAHPESSDSSVVRKSASPYINVRSNSELLEKSQTMSLPPQNSEVSSSTVGPSAPMEATSWSTSWDGSKDSETEDSLIEAPWTSSGVIVDPINTYHMGVALATKQTPFALLKSDNEPPVLVKIIDTKLPRGKQMLVPATAEDLRYGGKIIYDEEQNKNDQEAKVEAMTEMNTLQIRVPVVATVVPKLNEGHLQLTIEEPHHVFHTPMSSNVSVPCPEYRSQPPTCSLLPSAPSPPLDISLELFEPMECMPMSSRLPTDSDIGHLHVSDKSDDICITKFEDSIPLSDSE